MPAIMIPRLDETRVRNEAKAGPDQQRGWRRRVTMAAIAGAAGLLFIAAYLAPVWGEAPAPAANVRHWAFLYEEDLSRPYGMQYRGSVTWRTEQVSPDQPQEMAIRADVEIPERKLVMTWSLRRDTDKRSPASHLIEIEFRLPPDFPPGEIVYVPGVLMKTNESARGAPLIGHAMKVIGNAYLIGLTAADADRENNLRLLGERGWFDIPIVYGDKRRAIVTMEKGASGERIFAEVLTAWKQ